MDENDRKEAAGRPEEGPSGAAPVGQAADTDEGVPGESGGRLPSELDEEEDEAGSARLGMPGTAGSADGRAGTKTASGRPKASILNRVIARVIDLLIVMLLAWLPGLVGLLSGLTYLSIADGLMGGRSIGKRIVGLRVITSSDDEPGDFRTSIIRNSPLGVLYVIAHVPFIGWLIAVMGLAFETLLIIGSPEGRRLGDEIADSVVIDDPAPAKS